jgi:hypothetical protein
MDPTYYGGTDRTLDSPAAAAAAAAVVQSRSNQIRNTLKPCRLISNLCKKRIRNTGPETFGYNRPDYSTKKNSQTLSCFTYLRQL